MYKDQNGNVENAQTKPEGSVIVATSNTCIQSVACKEHRKWQELCACCCAISPSSTESVILSCTYTQELVLIFQRLGLVATCTVEMARLMCIL